MMSENQRDILNRNRVLVVRSLQVTDSLLACLREDYTLTEEMQELVTSETTPGKKAGKLLDILAKRGAKAFERFIYALVASGQDDIASELDRTLAASYIDGREEQRRQDRLQTQPAFRYTQHTAPAHSLPGVTMPYPVLMPYMVPQYIWPNGTVQAYPPPGFNPAQGTIQSHPHGFNPVENMAVSTQPTVTAWQETARPETAMSDAKRDETYHKYPVQVHSNETSVKTPDSPPSVGLSETERMKKIKTILDQIINAGPFMEFAVKYTSDFNQFSQVSMYPMRRLPRGHAVIINNKYFLTKKLMTRDGASYDVVNLCKIFEQLHFETIVREDQTAAEIRTLLKEEQLHPNHTKHDAFILFILTHGTGGYIYGNDGEKLSIEDDIAQLFDGLHCPALRGKPKIFFIQACQGESLSSRVDQRDGPHDNSDADTEVVLGDDLMRKLNELRIGDQDDFVPSIHEKADILMAYATTKGYQAWRRTDLGSWFVRCLVYVLSQRAHEKHLLDILTETNEILSQIETQPTPSMPIPYRQISQRSETLTQSLYFLPGYIA